LRLSGDPHALQNFAPTGLAWSQNAHWKAGIAITWQHGSPHDHALAKR
jgi:hypothetical protein